MNYKENILKLQRDFEANKISEQDMTPKQIEALHKLYDEQISLLNEMENMYKKKIDKYEEYTKNKIEELKQSSKSE